MNNFLFISYFDGFFLKVYIRPTKCVHPTYKKCISDLQNVYTSDLQKVYIGPTKSVHPTYKKSLTDLQMHIRPTKKCTSDLQKEFIRPTKSVYPTY